MLWCLLFLSCLSYCSGKCETSFRYHPRHAIWIGCETDTEKGRQMLEDIIYSTVRDYTYIRNASVMCEIVINRLSYRGIVIPSLEQCTNATITSEYGSTLSDLYSKFSYLDYNMMIKRENDLERNQLLCHSYCNVEDIFGLGLKYWIRENIPQLEMPPCVWGKDNLEINYGKECEPFSDFNPNTTNWDWQISDFEDCISCLEWTDVLYVRAILTLQNQGIYHGLLIPEIVSVWRYQMPKILSYVAHMLKLTGE